MLIENVKKKVFWPEGSKHTGCYKLLSLETLFINVKHILTNNLSINKNSLSIISHGLCEVSVTCPHELSITIEMIKCCIRT